MGEVQSKVKEIKALEKMKKPVQSQEQVRRLEECELTLLQEAFADFSKTCENGGCLKREQFKACLRDLGDNPNLNVKPEYVAFYDELFDTFDTNHDGEISREEFLAGMAVFCEGTPEEKIRLSFRAYCSESHSKHPYITRGDMYKMFKHAYLNMVLEMKARDGADSISDEEMKEWTKRATVAARDTCATAFSEVDTDGNNKISFKEFEHWAKTNPVISQALQVHGEEHSVEVPVVFSA